VDALAAVLVWRTFGFAAALAAAAWYTPHQPSLKNAMQQLRRTFFVSVFALLVFFAGAAFLATVVFFTVGAAFFATAFLGAAFAVGILAAGFFAAAVVAAFFAAGFFAGAGFLAGAGSAFLAVAGLAFWGDDKGGR
jgi:hypothetical protein